MTPRRSCRVRTACLALTFASALPVLAAAQDVEAEASQAPPRLAAPSPPPLDTPPDNPYSRRPQCASMFLKADWPLTFRQRTCDWIQNRLFSTSAVAGAAWSAGFSMARDAPSEDGLGFGTRFGRKFTQHAIKSAGSYAGGLLFHEDPRTRPPYLVLKPKPRPRGFLKRTVHALGTNFISYRCDGGRWLRTGPANCTRAEHIKKVPAVSRVVASLASGAASELWESETERSRNRALRGAASAYGATFVNALVAEFKPELNAAGGKIFRAIFGGR